VPAETVAASSAPEPDDFATVTVPKFGRARRRAAARLVDLMETSAGLVTMEVIIATRGVCEGGDAVASRVESGEARAENQQ
jgi:hypothetical protein